MNNLKMVIKQIDKGFKSSCIFVQCDTVEKYLELKNWSIRKEGRGEIIYQVNAFDNIIIYKGIVIRLFVEANSLGGKVKLATEEETMKGTDEIPFQMQTRGMVTELQQKGKDSIKNLIPSPEELRLSRKVEASLGVDLDIDKPLPTMLTIQSGSNTVRLQLLVKDNKITAEIITHNPKSGMGYPIDRFVIIQDEFASSKYITKST